MALVLSPQVIVGLALASGLLLLWRAYRKHNWAIFAASLPRLYLAGVYVWVIFLESPLEQRQAAIRMAVVLLLIIEIINHVLNGRDIYDR